MDPPKEKSTSAGVYAIHTPTTAEGHPSSSRRSISHSNPVDPTEASQDDGSLYMPKAVLLLRFPVKQSTIHIGSIVLGNVCTMGLIVLCLYVTARENSMSEWEKRVFNFTLLLLSAILTLGIGHLLDRLGLLARGQMLASNAHTELSIRYIIRGSMISVAHLLFDHVHKRPRTFNRTTVVAVIYLIFTISARLSVALLGLTFNVKESILPKQSVAVSQWPLPNERFTDVHSNANSMTLDTLFQYATVAIRIKTSDLEAKNTNLTSDSNESVRKTIEKTFTAKNITQTLAPGQSIATFEYNLREFNGDEIKASNRTVVVQTECRAYVVRNDTLKPGEVYLRGTRTREALNFTSDIFNPKIRPLDGFASERLFIPPDNVFNPSCGPLCVRIWLWDKFLNTPGEATYQCDNHLILPPLFLDSHVHDPRVNIQPSLADYLLRFAADSEQETAASSSASNGYRHRDVTDLEGFTNVANAIGLDESYDNGEIWVAAVLGRFTAVLIMYLDEALPKVQLKQRPEKVRGSLYVQWKRLGALAGVMIGIQILLAVGTIWYCMGSVLLPDEISPLQLTGHLTIPRSTTFSSMVSKRRPSRAEGEDFVRAWFRLKMRNGVRRWILECDGLKEGGGSKNEVSNAIEHSHLPSNTTRSEV